MTPRLAAAALFLGALLIELALTRPLGRDSAAAQERYFRLREEKRQLVARLRSEERAATRGRQAMRMELPEGSPKDAVGRLRHSLLESVRDQPVSGVRLAVSGGQAPVLAQGTFRAEGSFADMVLLSGRLVRPGSGLVLSRVRFSPTRAGGVALEVEGMSVAEGESP
jgi:hypothetical protein